jgi:hypothetical protein
MVSIILVFMGWVLNQRKVTAVCTPGEFYSLNDMGASPNDRKQQWTKEQ